MTRHPGAFNSPIALSLLPAPLFEATTFCFLFLRSRNSATTAIAAVAPSATPTPIPVLAPVVNPVEGGELAGLVLPLDWPVDVVDAIAELKADAEGFECVPLH